MKYRKRPVVIEAYCWDGDWKELCNWANQCSDGNGTVLLCIEKNNKTDLSIKTLEGIMNVPIGNYVICGIKGEFYSCEPNIFQMTYEKVENGN